MGGGKKFSQESFGGSPHLHLKETPNKVIGTMQVQLHNFWYTLPQR